MQFQAHLHRITQDADGEISVVIKVPLSDKSEVDKLSQKIQEVFTVNIE